MQTKKNSYYTRDEKDRESKGRRTQRRNEITVMDKNIVFFPLCQAKSKIYTRQDKTHFGLLLRGPALVLLKGLYLNINIETVEFLFHMVNDACLYCIETKCQIMFLGLAVHNMDGSGTTQA